MVTTGVFAVAALVFLLGMYGLMARIEKLEEQIRKLGNRVRELETRAR